LIKRTVYRDVIPVCYDSLQNAAELAYKTRSLLAVLMNNTAS